MKKSAFILLFLLASLPALMSRGAEAGAAAASDLRQTVKNSSISAQHSDFVATETFQLSVPGSFARPAQVERTVVAYDPRNAGALLRTVLRIRAPRLVAVRRFLTAGRAPSAARPTAPTISNSVFWSFSHPFPLRRHDTPAPEAIVRVCIYGYLRVGLHPSGGILRGRTFPTGSVPPAEEGLRSRTETCAPATNPFSHP